MAVGSLVTVAVLAVAALQGPKWFKGSEAATTSSTQSATTDTSTTQPPLQPQTEPVAASIPATNDPAVVPATPTVTTPTPEARRTVAQNVPPAGTPSSTGRSAPMAQNTVAAQQVQPAVNQPAIEQPSTPAASAADTAKLSALREAREHLVGLGSRANSARATLTRMKEQQARQGLGMRGDITTAEQRMENYLDDAEDAIKSGDPERAKKALASAEREIDRLDTFLGR
jgi:hypothetical protein